MTDQQQRVHVDIFWISKSDILTKILIKAIWDTDRQIESFHI